MKNIYLCLIILCVLAASCKKDSKTNQQPGKKYNVAFSVNNFTQQHTGFLGTDNLVTDATNSYIETNIDTATKYKVLYFIQADSAGGIAVLTKAVEYQGDSNFGTFSTQLLAGTYSFAIVGGENDFPGSGPLVGRNLFVSSLGETFYRKATGGANPTIADVNDLFYKYVTITVSDASINQTISLDRIVGKLDVVILDAIPANITSITVNVNPTSSDLVFPLTPANNANLTDTYTITPALQGTTGFDMSTLILNTTAPFTVTLTAYQNTTVVATKIISNVTCTANQITQLQGNLFGGNGTGGSIIVKGDTSWISGTINYHF